MKTINTLLTELHTIAKQPAYVYVNGSRQVAEVDVCEHCASLCHSQSGLYCDDITDGLWPCATMKIVLEMDSDHG